MNKQIKDEVLINRLENERATIKWVWLLVMAFAMQEAIVNVYDTHPWSVGSIGNDLLSGDFIVSLMLLIFVFVPVFIRFFLGDTRYLDRYYVEHIRYFCQHGDYDCINHELHALTPKRRFVDVINLSIHGLFFLFLAQSLKNPNNCSGLSALEPFVSECATSKVLIFGFLLISLLFVNVFWLTITLVIDERHDKRRRRAQGRKFVNEYAEMRKQMALRPAQDILETWIKNNVAFAMILTGVLISFAYGYIHSVSLLWLFFAFAILNTVFDFVLTWDYYFPEFKREIASEPQNSDDETEKG